MQSPQGRQLGRSGLAEELVSRDGPGGKPVYRRPGRYRARPPRARSDQSAGADPDAAEDDDTGPERGAVFDDCREQLPVGVGLQAPVSGRGPWTLVVDEQHPVTDEDVVLDRHSVTDERVALDLA